MEIVNWKRGLDEMLSCKLKHNSAVHIGNNRTEFIGQGKPGEPKLVGGTSGIGTKIPRPVERIVGGKIVRTEVGNGITVNFNDLLNTAFGAETPSNIDIINVTLPSNQQAAFQQAFNSLGINAVLNFIDTDKTNEVKLEFIQIDNTVGDVDK